MVAKAFTVSRSGVKRKTARERLLDHCDNRMAYWCGCDERAVGQGADMRATRRLLRALERELAERAMRRLLRALERELAERAMHEFDVRFDGRPFINGAKLKVAVRDAILGPQRKRGAR